MILSPAPTPRPPTAHPVLSTPRGGRGARLAGLCSPASFSWVLFPGTHTCAGPHVQERGLQLAGGGYADEGKGYRRPRPAQPSHASERQPPVVPPYPPRAAHARAPHPTTRPGRRQTLGATALPHQGRNPSPHALPVSAPWGLESGRRVAEASAGAQPRLPRVPRPAWGSGAGFVRTGARLSRAAPGRQSVRRRGRIDTRAALPCPHPAPLRCACAAAAAAATLDGSCGLSPGHPSAPLTHRGSCYTLQWGRCSGRAVSRVPAECAGRHSDSVQGQPASVHGWFSGRILACHAGGPGSIPGPCSLRSPFGPPAPTSQRLSLPPPCAQGMRTRPAPAQLSSAQLSWARVRPLTSAPSQRPSCPSLLRPGNGDPGSPGPLSPSPFPPQPSSCPTTPSHLLLVSSSPSTCALSPTRLPRLPTGTGRLHLLAPPLPVSSLPRLGPWHDPRVFSPSHCTVTLH